MIRGYDDGSTYTLGDLAADLDALIDMGLIVHDWRYGAWTGDPSECRYALTEAGQREVERIRAEAVREVEQAIALSARELQKARHAAELEDSNVVWLTGERWS